ncbi:hypothetical protein [Blautia producta]|uniref:hypothetical protein n=1 Tax=Blautia producta TaxID=33035 RepID=UPI0036F3968E
MGIDISRFKVIHGDKVLNAIALMDVRLPDGVSWDDRDTIIKPKDYGGTSLVCFDNW